MKRFKWYMLTAVMISMALILSACGGGGGGGTSASNVPSDTNNTDTTNDTGNTGDTAVDTDTTVGVLSNFLTMDSQAEYIATSGDSSIFTLGRTGYDCVLKKFAQNGTLLWKYQFTDIGYDMPVALKVYQSKVWAIIETAMGYNYLTTLDMNGNVLIKDSRVVGGRITSFGVNDLNVVIGNYVDTNFLHLFDHQMNALGSKLFGHDRFFLANDGFYLGLGSWLRRFDMETNMQWENYFGPQQDDYALPGSKIYDLIEYGEAVYAVGFQTKQVGEYQVGFPKIVAFNKANGNILWEKTLDIPYGWGEKVKVNANGIFFSVWISGSNPGSRIVKIPLTGGDPIVINSSGEDFDVIGKTAYVVRRNNEKYIDKLVLP